MSCCLCCHTHMLHMLPHQGVVLIQVQGTRCTHLQCLCRQFRGLHGMMAAAAAGLGARPQAAGRSSCTAEGQPAGSRLIRRGRHTGARRRLTAGACRRLPGLQHARVQVRVSQSRSRGWIGPPSAPLPASARTLRPRNTLCRHSPCAAAASHRAHYRQGLGLGCQPRPLPPPLPRPLQLLQHRARLCGRQRAVCQLASAPCRPGCPRSLSAGLTATV